MSETLRIAPHCCRRSQLLRPPHDCVASWAAPSLHPLVATAWYEEAREQVCAAHYPVALEALLQFAALGLDALLGKYGPAAREPKLWQAALGGVLPRGRAAPCCASPSSPRR